MRESEWLQVGACVYDHLDHISGISFLPYADHTYLQAPYQDCSAATIQELQQCTPTAIAWEDLAYFETQDTTGPSTTFACTATACEAVDIPPFHPAHQ